MREKPKSPRLCHGGGTRSNYRFMFSNRCPQPFPVKGQLVNTWGFAGHTMSQSFNSAIIAHKWPQKKRHKQRDIAMFQIKLCLPKQTTDQVCPSGLRSADPLQSLSGTEQVFYKNVAEWINKYKGSLVATVPYVPQWLLWSLFFFSHLSIRTGPCICLCRLHLQKDGRLGVCVLGGGGA